MSRMPIMSHVSNGEKDLKIDIKTMKWSAVGMVGSFFERYYRQDTTDIKDSFTKKYETLLQKYEQVDVTDLARLYRLISEFKPALASVLEPGVEFDEICDWMVDMFEDVNLAGVRRQMENKISRPKEDGPVVPGSDKTTTISFFCTICEQLFDIPEDMKEKLLKSDDKLELPKHHDKEMEIRISGGTKVSSTSMISDEEIALKSASDLMGHLSPKMADLRKLATIFPDHSSITKDDIGEYLKVLSVGIDVGSSTSHLVFSGLTLRRERSFLNMSNRFHLIDRKIIYEGNIIDTPLIDRYTIDIDAVVKFCVKEYRKAGIKSSMVDTGAVIVTGETAKKQNAAEIVRRLSSETGKFVSAAAGPNFESLLGAMGSGIVDMSLEKENTIMNVDVGGGTSNLAIAANGHVLSTSCINIGGRLLGIDENFKIWRIDEPTEFLMKELKMNYQLGDTISEEDVRTIAHEYAKALVEVMRGPATSTIAKELMMTSDLDFSIPIDEFSFSGGVAEMIYGDDKVYDDIGLYLAEEIKSLMDEHNLVMIEPENKIRATVIGAGSFSLSVSGSTCYFDKSIEFP